MTRLRPPALAVAGLALALPGVIWGLPDGWEIVGSTGSWEIGAARNDDTRHSTGAGEIEHGWDANELHRPGAWEVGAVAHDFPWHTPTATEGGGGSNGGRRPNPNDWR